MLSRSATILMAAATFTAAQAQQGFLESARNPTLYPTLKNNMGSDVAVATNDMGFDFTPDEVGIDVQLKCQLMAGLNFYDLQPLAIAQTEGFSNVSAADSPNKFIYISFCQDLPQALWCPKDPVATMAVLVELNAEGDQISCTPLSGESPTKNAAFNVSDPDNNDGLLIEYNGGAAGYDLTVDVQCDAGNDYVPVGSSFADNTKLSIAFKTKFGCKYGQLSQIWNFFENNRWAMFALFVIGGTILCFAGRAMLKPTLFITGVVIAAFIIVYIFYSTFLKSNTESWVGWAVLGGAALAGLLLGYLFAKFHKVGAFALAAWGGFSLGLILYNAFVYKLGGGDAAFWGTTIGCALILGLLTVVIFDHILILATAIMGSFMMCYGVGLVVGHYPNPFTIADLIKNGQLDDIDPMYYAYMGANVVLFLIGLIVQYKHKSRNPDYKPEERISFRGRYNPNPRYR